MNHKLIFALSCLLLCSNLSAEKKALDHDAYDSWESVSTVKLLKDGSVVAYTVKPQEGDSKTYFRNTITGAETLVERAGTLNIAEDLTKAVFLINPPFSETRQAKIDKKKADEMPSDSLAILDLKTFELKIVSAAKSFKTGYDAAPYIYILGKKDTMLVYNVSTSVSDTLKGVKAYAVSKDGLRLAYTTKKDKKDSLSVTSVVHYDAVKDSSIVLSEGLEDYSLPVFSYDGNRIVFMGTSDIEKDKGTPAYTLFLTEKEILQKASRKNPEISQLVTKQLDNTTPEGWLIAKGSNPRFSNSGNRIILNLHQYFPAKDTTLVEFEKAKLDIWVWDSPNLPPMDKVNKTALSLRACVNIADNKLITLSTNPYDKVTIPGDGDGDFAISEDTKDYKLANLWSEEGTSDFYKINLNDGSRSVIIKGLEGYSGISPYGKYIVYFDSDKANWWSINTLTLEQNNITEKAQSNFYDEEDDHPLCKQPIANPEFVGEDEAIVIVDRYDVWKFSLDGKKAENMTKGFGRNNNIVLRPKRIENPSNPYLYFIDRNLPKKGTIYLSAYNDIDSRNGFYSINAAKPSDPQGFIDTKTFATFVKALEAPTVVFTKADFKNPNDIYLGNLKKGLEDCFANGVQLSHINPQQAEYIWGDVQLVRWNAYDGTPLRGLLYTPENLDPNKSYPMMIYFYEKYSESLYSYRSPTPSASTIIIPFFVSRGYVVFIPDIVYKIDGLPGESAYNCICAGAEAMCQQFKFIDPKRMAIQGQSWGGYQTAYLVTRTNMFAAAGAGAPVGNMTSAYGGIRWESGNSRITQYEYGQSRVGKRLWDEGALELYIKNSPVFFAPNVETPLLIMHNDADGAVPWYQGIEFFMGLRRLNKPVWLLQYNEEQHNLMERKNRKDLSIRLSQFFDYYLLGAPMPVWMKSGIPYARKGYYYATEPAE